VGRGAVANPRVGFNQRSNAARRHVPAERSSSSEQAKYNASSADPMQRQQQQQQQQR
jgi:hypothetical protein